MASPAFPLEQEVAKGTASAEDVAKLRAWLATQPHLPADHITDLDLALTFHCCERSAEVTKQVLDLHFTLKTLFAGFFKDRCLDSRVENALDILLGAHLSARAHDGSKLLYVRLVDTDAGKFVFADCVRMVLMALDLCQREEGSWPGFVILIDMAGVSLGHIAKLDLHSLQHFFYFIQEALLVKLKGLHFLNAPPFMDRVLMLIKPFMKKKLMDVLQVHQTAAASLARSLPVAGLPVEAGGESRTLKELHDEVKAKMHANEAFFKEENLKRVTEARRPGRPKTITDIFGGVEGSFKKLEID